MKQVSIYVCIVLLIVSVFSTWKTTPQSDVRAGKGDGINETIESPDDFQSLISSLSGGSILTASTGEGGVTVLSGDKTYIGSWDDDDDDDDDYDYDDDDDDDDDDYGYDDDDDDDDDDRREKTYGSMTIREEVYMSSSQYVSTSNPRYRSDMDSTLNRSMTLYITKNERYYHSVGQIFSDAYVEGKSEGGGSQAYIDFDVEVYINYRKSQYLLKINKWVMLGSEAVVVSDDLIGKWASLRDADDASDIVSLIDGLNEEAFEALRTLLAEAIGQDSLHGSGNTYTLDKTEESASAGKTDTKLSLNLADPERPVVSMYVGYDYEKKEASGSTAAQASTYMDVTYTFENINNTVIEIDDDIDVLKLTSKNINRYIYLAE